MTQPSHQELADRMDTFGADLAEIKLAIAELVSLKADVAEIKGDVAETREIVQAWQAVKLSGKFIKWLGAVSAAVVALVAAVKGGFAFDIK